MPIILDFNQVFFSNIQMFFKNEAKSSNPNALGLLKHMVLSTILSYKKKFGREYGDIVIATDHIHYWRRDVFPQYKWKRKEARAKSDLDWDFIFKALETIKTELIENFPYKILRVDGAEADDIIAVMTKWWQENELERVGLLEQPQKIMIVSSDGDFVQLQKYEGVKQWAPMLKKFVKPKGKLEHYVIEHICTAGDDGIPNICSADDVFQKGVRQTSFRKNRLEEFFKYGIDACKNDEERRNFQRNQMLIDFNFIPKEIEQAIVEAYINQTPVKNKMKIYQYLVKNKMKLLIENSHEF